MIKKLTAWSLALLLTCALGLIARADTIRLKDGSVLQGQVVGFKDQQFTVLIGGGARGRRSRILLYVEDVESIEFDDQTGGQTLASDDNGSGGTQTPPVSRPSTTPRPSTTSGANFPTTTQRPSTTPQQPARPADNDNRQQQPVQRPSNSSRAPIFVPITPTPLRVRGDNTNNGWTNSGFVVSRGQRLRISATGRVTLGAAGASTPGGLSTVLDKDKLMRNEATGALVAVIGDDNDDFILIGRSREFVAQRDGVLFLGVNEGNLNDNTGAYEVTIEVESR